MVLTQAQFLKLILMSIVGSKFLPWTLLLGTEICEAWQETLPTKTETKTSLVSAFILSIRLPAPFIKENHFEVFHPLPVHPHKFVQHFLLPTFLSFSALALVFLIPPLHAQAIFPYTFLTACPCSCLLYTVF